MYSETIGVIQQPAAHTYVSRHTHWNGFHTYVIEAFVYILWVDPVESLGWSERKVLVKHVHLVVSAQCNEMVVRDTTSTHLGTYLVEVVGSVATVPRSVNSNLNNGHRTPLILYSMCA